MARRHIQSALSTTAWSICPNGSNWRSGYVPHVSQMQAWHSRSCWDRDQNASGRPAPLAVMSRHPETEAQKTQHPLPAGISLLPGHDRRHCVNGRHCGWYLLPTRLCAIEPSIAVHTQQAIRLSNLELMHLRLGTGSAAWPSGCFLPPSAAWLLLSDELTPVNQQTAPHFLT